MNYKLMKTILGDSVIWILIVLGMYMGNEIAANGLIFFLSIISAFGVFATLGNVIALRTSDMDDSMKLIDLAADRVRSKTKLHLGYLMVSTIVESVAIAATGHYFVATFYLVAGIGLMASNNAALSHSEKMNGEVRS